MNALQTENKAFPRSHTIKELVDEFGSDCVDYLSLLDTDPTNIKILNEFVHSGDLAEFSRMTNELFPDDTQPEAHQRQPEAQQGLVRPKVLLSIKELKTAYKECSGASWLDHLVALDHSDDDVKEYIAYRDELIGAGGDVNWSMIAISIEKMINNKAELNSNLEKAEKQSAQEMKVESFENVMIAFIESWDAYYLSSTNSILALSPDENSVNGVVTYKRTWVHLGIAAFKSEFNVYLGKCRSSLMSMNVSLSPAEQHDLNMIPKDFTAWSAVDPASPLTIEGIMVQINRHSFSATSSNRININDRFLNKIEIERKYWAKPDDYPCALGSECRTGEYTILPNGRKCYHICEECLRVIKPLLILIRDSICGHDPDSFEYLCRFMHWHLTKKDSHTLPLNSIFGAEGSGKNVFLNMFASVYHGKSAVGVFSSRTLGQFTNLMESVAVGAFNEVDRDPATAAEMKNIVGSDQIRIEGKGRDAYMIDNVLSLYVFTNDPYAGINLSMNAKENRRFSVIKTVHSLVDVVVASGEATSKQAANNYIKDVIIPATQDRAVTGRLYNWIGKMFNVDTQPLAFHGEAYHELICTQKDVVTDTVEAFMTAIEDAGYINWKKKSLFTKVMEYGMLCYGSKWSEKRVTKAIDTMLMMNPERFIVHDKRKKPSKKDNHDFQFIAGDIEIRKVSSGKSGHCMKKWNAHAASTLNIEETAAESLESVRNSHANENVAGINF